MGKPLDLKDRRIISVLEQDGRLANTQIGKKTGLASDVVAYRMNKLEEQGIIVGYLSLINYHKLGYIDFGIYLYLTNMSKVVEEEFISFISKHPRVSYFSKVGGSYNYIISILAKDPLEFNDVYQDLIRAFSSYVLTQEIVIRLFMESYNHEHLFAEDDIGKGQRVFHAFGGPISLEPIDELDKNILGYLGQGGRKKIVTMANELSTPSSTILTRIRSLEKRKIIGGCRVSLEPSKYGYRTYNLLVKVTGATANDERLLREICQSTSNIIWLIKTMGNWGYEVGVEVQNEEILQEILDVLKEKVDNIVSISFQTIFKTLKYTHYPFDVLKSESKL